MTDNSSTKVFINDILKAVEEIKSDNSRKSGPDYQNFDSYLSTITEHFLQKKINYIGSFIPRSINKESILEIGSGYGLNLLVLKFLGFKVVKGIEIVESIQYNSQLLINTAKKYVHFSLDDCSSVNGDAEATNFNNNEFHSIFAMEVISHVPSLDRLLRELNRILKNDGRIIIIDGNNLSCPNYRIKRYKIWKDIRERELYKRIQYIKNRFPEIDPNFRASIALHTELLSLEDMAKIIPDIVSSKKLPMNLYFEKYAPVYVETGIWDEYGFYPKKLEKQLRLYGFDSKTDIYIGGSRNIVIKTIQNLINTLPKDIKFLLRHSFNVNARKIENTTYLLN